MKRVDALETRLVPFPPQAPALMSSRLGVHHQQNNPVKSQSMMQFKSKRKVKELLSIIVLLFADMSTPNMLTGFGSQPIQGGMFGRVYHSPQASPAYNHIDEQLYQTKQWLKQRTLNLK